MPPPLTTCAQLKHFAREAEVNGQLEQAARFYQEVNYYNEHIYSQEAEYIKY